jgi:hypothetical protein
MLRSEGSRFEAMRLAILLGLGVITSFPCLGAELKSSAQDGSVLVTQLSVVCSLDDGFCNLESLIFGRCFEKKPFSDRLQLLELAVFQDSPPSTIADLPSRFDDLRKTVGAADSTQLKVMRERAQRFFGPPEPAKVTGLKRVGKVANAAYYVFRLAAYHNFSLADTYGDIMSGDLEEAYSLGLLTPNHSRMDR